jgi:hypothetical protein
MPSRAAGGWAGMDEAPIDPSSGSDRRRRSGLAPTSRVVLVAGTKRSIGRDPDRTHVMSRGEPFWSLAALARMSSNLDGERHDKGPMKAPSTSTHVPSPTLSIRHDDSSTTTVVDDWGVLAHRVP